MISQMRPPWTIRRRCRPLHNIGISKHDQFDPFCRFDFVSITEFIGMGFGMLIGGVFHFVSIPIPEGVNMTVLITPDFHSIIIFILPHRKWDFWRLHIHFDRPDHCPILPTFSHALCYTTVKRTPSFQICAIVASMKFPTSQFEVKGCPDQPTDRRSNRNRNDRDHSRTEPQEKYECNWSNYSHGKPIHWISRNQTFFSIRLRFYRSVHHLNLHLASIY